MEPIETERLLLLPAHPDLAWKTAAFYHKNRDFFAPLDPQREASFFIPEGQQVLLEAEREQFELRQSFRFYLVLRQQPGEIIGLAGLNNIVRGAFRSCFLGYKLGEEFQHQGYMSEGVTALCRWGLEKQGLHRIEANIMPRNLPSIAVAKRCGFQLEGMSPKYLRIAGVWEDHLHFVLLGPDEI